MSPLFNHSKPSYVGDFNRDLLEQYKLFVQSADNASNRRVVSSQYLLTLNTAIAAIYGYIISVQSVQVWAIIVPIVGVLAALIWLEIVRSYKRLNEIKFGIIIEMEKHLPVALYEFERDKLSHGEGRSYTAISKIEAWVPIGFLAVHIAASIFMASLVI